MHAGKLVLTVDGSRLVRAMVSRHLARHGCSVLEATDLAQARDLVREHRPALIVADGGLLPSLESDERCAAIPMIALAGRDDDVRRESAAAGWLVRPFQAQAFDREVSKALGAARGRGR